jgi:release factor glutamine methyltransferase
MSERVWTLLELLRWTTGFFREHGIASARLDAEVLLAHVLDMSRLQLYLAFDQPVCADDRATYRELVRRRAKQRVPVAYLTGRREFWSLDFEVTPDVLIPRPETEALLRAALALAPVRVAEVGVGSGCLVAALARELPGSRIVGVDVSEPALKLARRNLERLGLAQRVELVCGDLLSEVAGPFDLILSNPPYIPGEELDGLAPELQHEPRVALDGGPDGLEVIRRLAAQAPARLARPGHLALEVGAGQAAEVAELLQLSGADSVELQRDLGGVERVALARFGRG